jgi:alkanesulfonate monooxygenase SsuD/methylene tetrahydromethanopterin reductase-like flavin-dependent oxidoreductase (luciferase family)
MKVSITIDAMYGLDWPLWKTLVPKLDTMGFHTVFRSDHFMLPPKPQMASLELITSLTYLADHTERVKFGPLVAPISIRNPVMLVRQAMSLDDLSGGRMILGLGAGWYEYEHRMFGYPLGDKKTRLDRFSEAVEVIYHLTRDQQPVNYSGQYFRLEDAQLLPHSNTSILIGGNGPKRTLPLVARYADVWNCQVVPVDTFRGLSLLLDQLTAEAGRQPEDVQRTIMLPVGVWENSAGQERVRQHLQAAYPNFPLSDLESMDKFFQAFHGFCGTPDEVIAQMEAFEQAGADEFIIQWATLSDLESLELIAEKIIPLFARQSVS